MAAGETRAGKAGGALQFLQTRLSWAKAAVFAAAAATACVFFIDWCDFLFRCGCESLWAAAAAHCNIHEASPPHCPWCIEHGRYGGMAFAAVVIAQAGAAFRPGPLTPARVLTIFLAFPAAAALAGAPAALWTGYW